MSCLNLIRCLEEISDIMNVDKYEFSKAIFNVINIEREAYLRKKFKGHIKEKELIKLL